MVRTTFSQVLEEPLMFSSTCGASVSEEVEAYGAYRCEVRESEMIVTDPTEMYRVDDLIHDRWFSVQDIEYVAETGEFVIFYADDDRIDRRSLSSAKGQPSLVRLIVRNVVSYEFKDSERIVWYDFNRIRFSEKSGRLDVLTNIPLLIRLGVSALDIRVAYCDSAGQVGLAES